MKRTRKSLLLLGATLVLSAGGAFASDTAYEAREIDQINALESEARISEGRGYAARDAERKVSSDAYGAHNYLGSSGRAASADHEANPDAYDSHDYLGSSGRAAATNREVNPDAYRSHDYMGSSRRATHTDRQVDSADDYDYMGSSAGAAEIKRWHLSAPAMGQSPVTP